MNVPAIIYAGDTVKWNEPATADYSSAAGWTATFALRHGTGNAAMNITGVADGVAGGELGHRRTCDGRCDQQRQREGHGVPVRAHAKRPSAACRRCWWTCSHAARASTGSGRLKW